MPSIFLTTNPSYLLASYIPAFLVPSSFLPSVLTNLYSPVLPFVCILSFPSFSVSLPFSISYRHPFLCTSSSIYILLSCQSVIIFSTSLFIRFSFLSFCFLFSLPLLIQFVCIRVCSYFSSACVSHFHSILLRRTLAHVATFLFSFGWCPVRISGKTLS